MFQLDPIQLAKIQKPRGAKTETTCVIFKPGSSKILFPTSRLSVRPFVRSSVRRLAPIPAGESQDY